MGNFHWVVIIGVYLSLSCLHLVCCRCLIRRIFSVCRQSQFTLFACIVPSHMRLLRIFSPTSHLYCFTAFSLCLLLCSTSVVSTTAIGFILLVLHTSANITPTR